MSSADPPVPQLPRQRLDGEIARAAKVNWYAPLQLARTAGDVVVSTLFGRHADFRLIEALSADPDARSATLSIPDYSSETCPFWLDYVADTGDGWNATYTIAYHVAQPRLVPADGPPTERGRVLIFGGDEVYPVASRDAYEDRLLGPYAAALPPLVGAADDAPPAERPDVYAVPGNHDWYDSLVSFTRLFCTRASVAGWRAPQERSYFVLKLPKGWWLIGTDVQLGSDIDQQQQEYFARAAKDIGPDDRLILCNAEPHWVYSELYREMDAAYARSTLRQVEEALGKRAQVYLSGDLHHYARYDNGAGVQRITSGGGGAFLHATHRGMPAKLSQSSSTLRSTYPPPRNSAALSLWNLAFLFFNAKFALACGILYTLTAWVVMAPIGDERDLGAALYTTVATILADPFRVFWIVAIVGAFWLFTDTHSRRYRLFAAPVHGGAHLAAIFLLGWAVACATVGWLGLAFDTPPQLLLAVIPMFAGGAILGSTILGIYLFVSLNVFGRHHNEASSSLAVEDWKQFLRLKIDESGDLTIFAIGIDRVARRFRPPQSGETTSWLVPADASPPHLIEAPICVAGRGPARPGPS